MAIEVNGHYIPSEDEPFMNERQREYFRHKLLIWKDDILKEAQRNARHLQDENKNSPRSRRPRLLRNRPLPRTSRPRPPAQAHLQDRAALKRIDEGTYGYCEETGEPISLRRLDARPIATLSIEAQERHERRESVYRDD